jgi:signal transduction histidine kinase
VFSKLSIQLKITLLLSALLVLAVSLNVLWSYANQTAQAEREMLEKTQILNQELRAVWEFIDINQKRIDTDADGNYNFKNIYCAIAGKSVAAIFMRDTDYVVRYVSLNPRKINSRSDDYETVALEYFNATGNSDEIYEITSYREREVFRYTSPIYIEESCLSCHGEPAGETDVTGYPKEGLRVGDLAGAVSIIMPIDIYMQGIQQGIVSQSLYFFAVMAILIVIAFLAISYLVRRVERANTLLKQESSYKSDFLATMSHELRTPLTSIIAFTEIWEKTSGEASTQEQGVITEVKENSYILLEMVNNILEAARIEAGRTELHREWVDLVDLLSTVEGVIKPLADRKNIDFSTRVAPEVPLIYADWEKLRRIVENLASNAVKFTKPSGEVSIMVSRQSAPDADDASSRTASGEVLIAVSDTGIGIRDEDIERLFKRFIQLDQSAQRRYRGSGMGLAVVKDLVDAHGGKVTVHSVHKQGSVFTVYIPIGGVPDDLEDTSSAPTTRHDSKT